MIPAYKETTSFKNPKMLFLLPVELQNDIKAFALHSGLEYFNKNGLSRRFCNVNNYNIPLTSKLKIFASKCYGDIGVKSYKDEPYFGNFIGVNSLGGFVHKHTDPAPPGHSHVRLNFFVQKPVEGGDIIINSNIINNVKEQESWINFASLWHHGSTPVQGNIDRIVLSLGALIPAAKATEIYDSLPSN